MIRCKVCPDGGAVDRIGSAFCCMRCGTVSSTFQPEGTFHDNVAFRDKNAYSDNLIDRLNSTPVNEKRKHRLFHVMDAFRQQTGKLYEFREYSIEIQRDCENLIRRIVERCYSTQEEHGKSVTLTRSPQIMSTACLLIVFTNARPFYGAIHPKTIITTSDSGEKDFEKKVLKLKQRIESNPYINIFNCGIIAQVSEIKKIEHVYSCTCSKLEIPYKDSSKVFDLYMYIIDNVLLKGRNPNCIVAAVLVHCFNDENRCKNKLVEPFSSYTLSEEQIKTLCEELNQRRKTLDQCVENLRCICCQFEEKGKRRKRKQREEVVIEEEDLKKQKIIEEEF